MRRPSSCAGLVAALLLAAGCATTGRPPIQRVEEGIAALQAPLPGDLSALYRMRVAETGGLRLAVAVRDGTGRLVVSRPFGGAVAMAAWAPGMTRLFDLERGCEADPGRAAAMVGLGALPLEEVPRILGGRLPRAETRVLDPRQGVVALDGDGWTARARLAPDPWRVVGLEVSGGTTVALSRHTASVPGRLRIERPGGRWIELELARLEWDAATPLPPLPSLPPCPERSAPPAP